jgi:hypothetical protein
MWPEKKSSRGQLPLKLSDGPLIETAWQSHTQITHAEVEQLFITPGDPGCRNDLLGSASELNVCSPHRVITKKPRSTPFCLRLNIAFP